MLCAIMVRNHQTQSLLDRVIIHFPRLGVENVDDLRCQEVKIMRRNIQKIDNMAADLAMPCEVPILNTGRFVKNAGKLRDLG
jgi:hypothetical protein